MNKNELNKSIVPSNWKLCLEIDIIERNLKIWLINLQLDTLNCFEPVNAASSQKQSLIQQAIFN